MKKIKRFFRRISTSANLITAILFIAAAYSDRIPPETSMIITFMGLGFPFFLTAVLLFLLYQMLTSNWKLVPISVLALALCWGPIQNYCPFNLTKDLPKEKTLKVLSYNVMGFNYSDYTKEKPNPILDYIANSKADIVCLQEYWAHDFSNFLDSKKIYKVLSMYPYRSIIHLIRSHNAHNGIAIFSKYPISNTKRIRYESKNNGSMSCTINVDGKKILLINNHLESFKLTPADKSTYSTLIKGEEVDKKVLGGVYGTIKKKLVPAYLLRANQAKEVNRLIRETKSKYVIVCGDFNDTPISYTHRTMQGALKDAFVESGKGLGISFNESFFWFRLDNILHSDNMESYNCTVDRSAGSDHYPIWCHLRFKE